jgi:hypothetical protein
MANILQSVSEIRLFWCWVLTSAWIQSMQTKRSTSFHMRIFAYPTVYLILSFVTWVACPSRCWLRISALLTTIKKILHYSRIVGKLPNVCPHSVSVRQMCLSKDIKAEASVPHVYYMLHVHDICTHYIISCLFCCAVSCTVVSMFHLITKIIKSHIWIETH